MTLPWTRTSSRRRCEIIQRVGEAQQPLRAMRTKARDGFIKALRDAHRWLDELLVDPTQTIESLAIREGKSERSIRMKLSLAFMSPALAEAAMEGRLPRGFCIKRLTDLPMLWSEQWAPSDCRRRLRFETNSADPSRSFPRAANLLVVIGRRSVGWLKAGHDGRRWFFTSTPSWTAGVASEARAVADHSEVAAFGRLRRHNPSCGPPPAYRRQTSGCAKSTPLIVRGAASTRRRSCLRPRVSSVTRAR